MERIEEAQEVYQAQFVPFTRTDQIERQEYIVERTLYHLKNPRVKEVGILVSEEWHLETFIASYYGEKGNTPEGQKQAINIFLAAIEKTALQVATDEADE